MVTVSHYTIAITGSVVVVVVVVVDDGGGGGGGIFEAGN